MYKKVYRQEGGLAEEGYRAQIREAARKKIEDFNRRNRGEVAQRVRTPKPRFIPQRGSSGLMALPKAIENLKGKDLSEIFNVGETQAGKFLNRVNKLSSDYYDPTKGDEGNLARHAGASRELANILTPPIPGGEFIGNVGANLGGITEEISDILQRGSSYIPAALEDIKANYQGAPIFGGGRFPDAQTAEDIYEDVYGYKVDREGNRIVDEWGGLASLPEAQADEPWSTTDWDTFVSKRKEDPDTDLQYIGPEVQPTVNPLDYQNEFNFRRNYLSDYIDSSQDKFGDEGKLYSYGYIPEVSPMYNATQETGRSFDPQIFSEYQKASDAADRAWGYRYNPEQNTTVNIQPTGFAETGYGQFSPQPTTNIEVPPEVAQNVAVSVTTPGYYNYQEGLNRVLYPGLSGSTGFQNQQQVLPSLMK